MQANEFNLVFCGLATAAATIGYACSRRLSGSRSSRPTDLHEKTPNDLEAGLPSIGQKRKRMDHDFDEVKSDIGYPHNLKQIYPHKRARTPTPPPEAATTSALQSLGTAFEMLPSTQGTSTTPQQEVPVYTQSVQQELPSDDQPSGEAQTVLVGQASTSASAIEEPVSSGQSIDIAFLGQHQDTQDVTHTEEDVFLCKPEASAQAQFTIEDLYAQRPAQQKPAEEAEVAPAACGADEQTTAATPAADKETLADPDASLTKAMGPAGHDNATAGPVEVAALEQPVAVAPESMTASSGSKEDEVKKSATTCPKTPPAHPKMPETPKPTPARRGFAAFAGSASPFATLSTPKASSSAAPSWASPRATPGGASPPAWLSPTTPAWAKRDSGSPPSPNGKQPVALVPQVYATPVAQGQTTGEENEDATAEIRGVRLYTKRGAKGFSEGIVGTMKLLRHKETQKQRLLFRRDPLWQVVMNVRMQEGMRCAYDAEERVVRIVTRETSNEAKAEIVVYAVKPSRSCPKDKFAKFAQDITAVVSSLSSPA